MIQDSTAQSIQHAFAQVAVEGYRTSEILKKLNKLLKTNEKNKLHRCIKRNTEKIRTRK